MSSFEGSKKSGVKTFVRGGIVNATKGQKTRISLLSVCDKEQLYNGSALFVCFGMTRL